LSHAKGAPVERPTKIAIPNDDLATPWQRLGAATVDGLLFVIPFGLLTVLYFDDGPLWFRIGVPVLVAAYQIVGTALWGQTVGKCLVRIRVCSGQDLGRPGWLRATKRWGVVVAVGYVPVVGGLLSPLIVLPLLWTTNRQGLHDMFADTLVLTEEAAPWA
jgi:uncharacterized RDD family membrane protein YckC